jgi:hypothetical protein
MISSSDFHRIKYRYPNLDSKGIEIEYLYGFDTEAFTSGKPFLYTFSDGKIYHEKDIEAATLIMDIFDNFKGCDCAVYNLKYDSGALLYNLPKDNKIELWKTTFTRFLSLKIEYIPHKALIISKGKQRLRFWDIAQFFHQSLDSAAKKYLGESKIDMETKIFTREYVEKNIKEIRKYCLQDSILTSKLGNFFLKKLEEFGMRCTSLYSGASLSFRYFADNAKIVTSWRFWKYYPEVLKYALDSYEGGKFEITARGSFQGYEYDLCSAYPSEIRNLIDISLCHVVKSSKYQNDSIYGFIRCHIKNKGFHVPFGIMKNNVRIYPTGEYYLTITKAEYDYAVSIGIEIEIISGFWLFVEDIHYLYRKPVDTIFNLKSKYKNKDAALYNTCKIIANSFYGKLCQVIENYKNEAVAGIGWNPVYASIITANTRIKVCRMQNLLKEKCIAVHTDSIMTLEPIDKKYVSGKLGEFDFVTNGDGILIACGQYEIGDKDAYKGFNPLHADDWIKILNKNLNKSIIEYPVLKVESWIEAVAKGHFNKINLFSKEVKKIDLNADIKRTWLKNIKAKNLLERLEQSLPMIICETKKPEGW